MDTIKRLSAVQLSIAKSSIGIVLNGMDEVRARIAEGKISDNEWQSYINRIFGGWEEFLREAREELEQAQ